MHPSLRSQQPSSRQAVREMNDPFKIDGPAKIGFSGGRTSGMMLKLIVDAHGGALPADVLVTFANTGKERPQTLAFVNECATRWNVAIHWLEYRPVRPFFVEVSYLTADRKGRPFEQMVRKERYMPNPSKRLCTKHLKVKTQSRYAKACGLRDWTAVIGMRADEPDRVANNRGKTGLGYGCADIAMPLADAGLGERDVLEFWARQPFDLQLPRGVSNCDLCFLKGTAQRIEAIRAEPELADWWIAMEEERGMQFRGAAPLYRALKQYALDQGSFDFSGINDSLGDCVCTD